MYELPWAKNVNAFVRYIKTLRPHDLAAKRRLNLVEVRKISGDAEHAGGENARVEMENRGGECKGRNHRSRKRRRRL